VFSFKQDFTTHQACFIDFGINKTGLIPRKKEHEKMTLPLCTFAPLRETENYN